ncbi:MAG: hypothetical protein HC853_13905 [Anaerolineae bacterium]|nr:hypothetical protein [Anaerolineae bacterium]
MNAVEFVWFSRVILGGSVSAASNIIGRAMAVVMSVLMSSAHRVRKM